MSRSPLLRSISFTAVCLLTLSGCSVGRTLVARMSSASSNHVHETATAKEGDDEPTEGLDADTPVDPLEYGNCTSSDVRDYDEELTDNDEEDNRAQAEAQVTKVVPASDQVDITGDDLSADRVVKVSAGARDVTITSTNLVVIIEGEIESLTVRGFDNTIRIKRWRQSQLRLLELRAAAVEGRPARPQCDWKGRPRTGHPLLPRLLLIRSPKS